MVPVHSKVLKPEDVQEANGPARALHVLGGGLVNRGIDLVYNPHEEPPVDPLRRRAAASAAGLSRTSSGDRPSPVGGAARSSRPTPVLKVFPLPGAPSSAGTVPIHSSKLPQDTFPNLTVQEGTLLWAPISPHFSASPPALSILRVPEPSTGPRAGRGAMGSKRETLQTGRIRSPPCLTQSLFSVSFEETREGALGLRTTAQQTECPKDVTQYEVQRTGDQSRPEWRA